MQKRIALLVFTILTLTLFASAQASPPASASCDLGMGKTIKTDYSSPRLRGRKMVGGVDPYGKVWRNGANAATTFVTSADISGRNERARGELYIVRFPDGRKVDPYHQQEDDKRRKTNMGHPL